MKTSFFPKRTRTGERIVTLLTPVGKFDKLEEEHVIFAEMDSRITGGSPQPFLRIRN